MDSQKQATQTQSSTQTHQTHQNNKIQIPDPVYYAGIQFYDGDRLIKYTDCWQISVLRFLHLVFGENGKINMEKLTKLMNIQDQNCKKLINYFQDHNAYSYNCQDYKTKDGFKIRSDWCQFVNKSNLMKLKIDKKYQVAATVPNLIAFFKGFFPKIIANYQSLKQLNYQNVKDKSLFNSYEIILKKIYQQLNFDFKIRLEIETNSNQFDQDCIFFSTMQKISLNGDYLLDWQIYQFYDIKDKIIKQRLSGHSDYKYIFKKQ